MKDPLFFAERIPLADGPKRHVSDKQKIAQRRLLRKLELNKSSTAIFPSEAPQRIAELKQLSDQANVPIRIIHIDLSTDTETIVNHEPQ